MTGTTRQRREEPEAQTAPLEERVSHWITKGFLALAAIATSLLLTFGGWLVMSVNEINRNTSVMQTEFSASKESLGELKSSVDLLRMKSEGWATKDSLASARENIRVEIEDLKDKVQELEIRMARMEPVQPTARK